MKKLIRKSMEFLFTKGPDFITFPLMRRMIDSSMENLPEGLEVKIAETVEELEASFRLVQEAYADIKIADLKESPLRVNKYHALPTTAIIVVKIKGEIIATLSIIVSNRFKLPLEALWDIPEIKDQGRTAEISSLAVKKSYRRSAGKITMPIMLFLYQYSIKFMGIKNFAISVHPKAAIFYRAIFNFKYITREIKRYEFVNNAPATALVLDLTFWQMHKAKSKYFKILDPIVNGDYKFFGFPKEKYYCSLGKVMSPKMIDYFFTKKTSALHEMEQADIDFLKEVYHFEEYQNVLASGIKSEEKYFIYCNADIVIGGKVFEFDTYAINDHKVFGKIYNTELESQSECHIKLDISRYESILLKGTVTMKDDFIQVAVIGDQTWKEFVSYVKEKYKKSNHDSDKELEELAA